MKLTQLAGYGSPEKLPPVVTFRHEDWMREEKPYTAEAIKFMNQQMHYVQRDRTGHVSASALASCGRQQQFTWMGLPQVPSSLRGLGILANGEFMHLRWQMSGLSAGWLAEAEVPIPENPYDIRGTMDGIADTGEIIEFKSINDRGYNMLKGAPKPEHLMQVHCYMLATDKDVATIIYENKNTQEFTEFVIPRDEEQIEGVVLRAQWVQEETSQKKLIPMLESCIDEKGYIYDYCPYKAQCPSMRKIP